MKKILIFPFVLLILLSCGDDEDPIRDVLITNKRGTGQFYTVDVSNGNITPAFTITYNGQTLTEVRGFVYHKKLDRFFVSVSSYADFGNGDQLGLLFSVDPNTKEATLINDNDGKVNPGDVVESYDIWDAVVNWAVEADDSLVAVGDFNSDGNGFVRFGTNGGRSLTTLDADVCCGLGMIYNAKTAQALLANGENQDNGEVDFEQFDTNTGKSLYLIRLRNFEGFPADFNNVFESSDLYVKAIASEGNTTSGTIYGLMFNEEEDSRKTYFVSINLTTLKVTYISTIAETNEDQFNMLAFIPENKL
jgi:hypothetical protein